MTDQQPGGEEVRRWFDELSNWGRWGDDDALGTLNHVDDGVRSRAMGVARDGRLVACGRPLRRGMGTTQPTVRFVTRSGGEAPAAGMGFADDWWGVGIHGFDVTHLDAPSHLFWDGRMYNGRSASVVTTTDGAGFGDVAVVSGIVTRGVFLDVPAFRGVEWLEPGTAVDPHELDACAAAGGAEVGRGDAVIVRLGRDAADRAGASSDPMTAGVPGLHASCLPWLHEREVAVLVSDVISDAMPSGVPGMSMPIHSIGIVAMGLWLLDNAWLEGLADACAQAGRAECCFVVAPLRLTGGTGSPVNPIALL